MFLKVLAERVTLMEYGLHVDKKHLLKNLGLGPFVNNLKELANMVIMIENGLLTKPFERL